MALPLFQGVNGNMNRKVMKKGKHSKEREAKNMEFDVARKQRSKLIGVIIISLIVILLVVIVLFNMFNENDRVKIPLSEVTDTAKFYSYDSNGVEVKYFVVMGSDATVHAACDACDMCFSDKLGYQQVGEAMVCGKCDKNFTINLIGFENITGECWPGYLEYSIEGGNVIILKTDLDAVRRFFV